MPIHDWGRVSDLLYFNFQLGMVVGVSSELNHGILPSSHYALIESLDLRPPSGLAEEPEPDHIRDDPRRPDQVRSAEEVPPTARFRFTDDRNQYAGRAVTVRDDLDRAVATVLFPTAQDKNTPYRLDALVQLAVGALTRGVHLAVVDLTPPGPAAPRGIHHTIWSRIRPGPCDLPRDKPLAVASYQAGIELNAYVEPLGVGDPLPDMPLFLDRDRYVMCPLAEAYRRAWDTFPAPLKPRLEPPRG